MINSDFISNIFNRACETHSKEEFRIPTHFPSATSYAPGAEIDYVSSNDASPQSICHELIHLIQQK